MAELNVNDITTNTIDPTDKVYGFNANESKAPTVQTLLGAAPGIMAVGTCATAAATAAKAVTSANWTDKPGQSILIEFTNANTANNVTLSINQGNAIPVYYLNCATEQISGNAIPAGAVIFTLNAAGNKFYAHLTKTLSAVDTTSKLPVDSSIFSAYLKKSEVITPYIANLTYYKYTITDEVGKLGNGVILLQLFTDVALLVKSSRTPFFKIIPLTTSINIKVSVLSETEIVIRFPGDKVFAMQGISKMFSSGLGAYQDIIITRTNSTETEYNSGNIIY